MNALDHARALVALLEAEAGTEAPAGPPRATLGVQIDAEALAELVELAARMRLTPSQTLRLALRALVAELARPKRMVGRSGGCWRGSGGRRILEK
jgi:hypothetical protein